jgi:hypothetical protein
LKRDLFIETQHSLNPRSLMATRIVSHYCKELFPQPMILG